MEKLLRKEFAFLIKLKVYKKQILFLLGFVFLVLFLFELLAFFISKFVFKSFVYMYKYTFLI